MYGYPCARRAFSFAILMLALSFPGPVPRLRNFPAPPLTPYGRKPP